ncbi:MAG: alpha-galactosidase [Leptospiraceae bacterium]|nr:alpha-galactosidase [Leptospiraceae bacterium]
MAAQFRGKLTYTIDGVLNEIVWGKEKNVQNNDLQFNSRNISSSKGEVYRIELLPRGNTRISLQDFLLEIPLSFDEQTKIFVNGFQSWTESREYLPHEEIPDLSFLAGLLLKPYGDYNFREKGNSLRSWSYTYLRKKDSSDIQLFGSLTEEGGYTYFEFSKERDLLIIRKDIAGRVLSGPFPVLSLFMFSGSESSVFAQYSHMMGVTPVRPLNIRQNVTGFTSWYNYYTNISASVLQNCLNEFIKNSVPIEYFQIDDGWQAAVGDWLECNSKFQSNKTNHLAELVTKIHDQQIKAGLWLAPFICEKNSRIFKEHYEWVLKDKSGKPIKAGFNPLWSYTFFALDFYNLEFQDYLKQVFNRVFREWNFDLVKLDFLYAVALQPKEDKTRGEIMTEAMQFLRTLCKGKEILGCGVPLLPAAGLVDYCRIGADVHLSWENSLLAKNNYRERVSTYASLQSTISRRQLNGLWFRNDPDVIFLRDEKRTGKRNLIGLSPAERQTLLYLNSLFGGLIFTSDSLQTYDAEKIKQYLSSFPSRNMKILETRSEKDLFIFNFLNVQGMMLILYANLSNEARAISLPEGLKYLATLDQFTLERELTLQPHESLLINVVRKEGFAGSTGHLFPGNEWETFQKTGTRYRVALHRSALHKPFKLYLLLNGRTRNIAVNDIKGEIYDFSGYQLAMLEYQGEKK